MIKISSLLSVLESIYGFNRGCRYFKAPRAKNKTKEINAIWEQFVSFELNITPSYCNNVNTCWTWLIWSSRIRDNMMMSYK